MRQITFNLDEHSRRPVIKLDWFKGCRALLDTGALFPVWTASGEILKSLNAKLVNSNVSFGGFGGDTSGSLYRVHFWLDKNLPIVFANMSIVAKDMENLNCHLILPATMFDNMVYEVDTINHKLNISIPDNQAVRHLKLSDSSGKLSVYLAGTYESIEDYNMNSNSLSETTDISIVDAEGNILSDEELIRELFRK